MSRVPSSTTPKGDSSGITAASALFLTAGVLVVTFIFVFFNSSESADFSTSTFLGRASTCVLPFVFLGSLSFRYPRTALVLGDLAYGILIVVAFARAESGQIPIGILDAVCIGLLGQATVRVLRNKPTPSPGNDVEQQTGT